ncbi:MAG TPA: hypothetical protein PLA68_11210 [Panacibacter sp.]|nr:hypothetical protein [Panacibacter sp.]
MPQLCNAQDSACINFLIKRIADQQVKEDSYFLQGIFPSYISKKEAFSNKKKDNNIFYNTLIAYTLSDIKSYVTKDNQLLIDELPANAKPLYSKFKNQKGRNTYNFWRTDTAFKYPYAGLINPFSKDITLPDDMDDTVLSLLALNVDDSTAATVHELMQSFTNNGLNEFRSVIKMYDGLPAYSTWFGKKFPVVFDVSVLCNILSFVQLHNLSWTTADSASLEVIIKTVENNYHIAEPEYASPYYPKTSIILYHIARLMDIKKIPQLEALKVKLVTDAVNEFGGSNNMLEKIILSSAVLKWGYTPPLFQLPAMNDIETEMEQNDFSFFVGNIPSYFPGWLRKMATDKKKGLFYHYCPAYNDALLLEYLVLRNK